MRARNRHLMFDRLDGRLVLNAGAAAATTCIIPDTGWVDSSVTNNNNTTTTVTAESLIPTPSDCMAQ